MGIVIIPCVYPAVGPSVCISIPSAEDIIQMDFVQRKVLYLDYDLTEVYSVGCNEQYVHQIQCISWNDNALVPNRPLMTKFSDDKWAPFTNKD